LASRRIGREACPRFTARGRLRRLVSRMSEPSLPFTARGRFGDTRSRLAAGSGWRKPQDPTHCSRQVWGRAQSLLAAGLNPNTAGLPDIRREGGRTGQTTQHPTSKQQHKTPPTTNPDRRPSRPSPAGGIISLLSGIMC
jgi:hypothetical protein